MIKIEAYIDRGNSFPVILQDNNEKYFVKLRAGMSGQYAMVSEWIGNRLGQQLGIHTQIPKWIELNQEVVVGEIHIEVRDLIAKSHGLNIGFKYLEEAKEVDEREVKRLDKKISDEIYLFDLIMLNIDRTPSNLNLMNVKDELISVDYESSLLFQELLGSNSLLNDDRILLCLKSNPLYREISEEAIDTFIEKLERLSIHEALAAVPLSLFSEAERNTLIKGFAEKQKNQWFLKETMRKLKSIEIESMAAKKRRINRNQADFKRRFREI